MMFNSLKRLSKSVQTENHSLADSPLHISRNRLQRAAESLSSSANQQSAAIQQTIASLTEIRSMLSQTDKMVKQSENLTQKATSQSQAGDVTVAKLNHTMNSLAETNEQVEQLNKVFHTINKKMRLIHDIVFKTQLVSYNASIEAARAGHFGRGFAVVAEEVGRLAQTSGKTAKEIDLLLSDSTQQVSNIVADILKRIEDGRGATGEVNKSFSEISISIAEIASTMQQITEASREQVTGIEQTSKAIEQIDKATQDNRKSADELRDIANALVIDTITQQPLSHSITTSRIHASQLPENISADDPSFLPISTKEK